MAGIIRKRLSEDEGNPPDTRYNPDCDCVETSADGGVTWVENAGADPRVNTAYQLPPNVEPDPRCAAAAGMVAYVRSVVDAGIAGTTAIGIANGVFAIVLVFIPVTWFFALIWAVGTAIFELGAAALAFSFTEEVYDQLLCIFYANIDGDGVMTDEGLASIYAEVEALGDITVTAAFGLAVQPMGFVGMTNAGAKLADDEADCDDCATCNAIYDFTLGEELGWSLVPGTVNPSFPVGTWDTDGWLSGAGLGAVQAVYIWFPCENPEYDSMEVEYIASETGTMYFYLSNEDGSSFDELGSVTFLNTGGVPSTREITGLSVSASGIKMIAVGTTQVSGTIKIRKVGVGVPLS